MEYILPKVKKYVEAICKPYFVANQQNMTIAVEKIRAEIRAEYEDRIATLEAKVAELIG